MSLRLDKIRLAIKRAPSNLKDRVFSLACTLLLPLSTTCKVCNMLRGMAIGILLGTGASCAIALLIHNLGCK